MNPINKRHVTIRLNSLTSLRFFAILLIVLHHLTVLISWHPLSRWGALGVSFFFVLSGFVITLNYRNPKGIRDSFYFLWNRLIRTYPVHIVTFFLCLVLLYFQNRPIDLSAGVLNVLLLQSYFSQKEIYLSFNHLSWALSTLFFFYILFALIIYRPYRNLLLGFSLSVISLACSVSYIETHDCPPIFIHWLLYAFPPNRLLNFLFGIVASLVFIKFYERIRGRLGLISATLLEAVTLLMVLDRVFFSILLGFFTKCLFTIAPQFKQSAPHIMDLYLVSNILGSSEESVGKKG